PARARLRNLQPFPTRRSSVLAGSDESRDPLRRVWLSAALTIPVMVLSMVPASQLAGWQWLALALTLPVVTWGAWPFHRAAAINLDRKSTRLNSSHVSISYAVV